MAWKSAGWALAGSLLVASIDQGIKGLVVKSLSRNESLPLWPHVLALTPTRNTGTAFSLFSAAPNWVLVALAVVILGLFSLFMLPYLSSRLGLCIAALVIGGALGNLYDRVMRHGVVDYLELRCIRWPIFNLADACVVIGVGLLLIQMLRTERVVPPGGNPA